MEKSKDQLKAEEAAKVAAEKAKLQKEAEAAERKKQEDAAKLQTSMSAATAALANLKTASGVAATAFGSLTEISSADDVTAAGKVLDEQVKVSKDAMKVLKAELRKFKDHGAIQDMHNDGEVTLSALTDLQGTVKDRVKAAKDAAKKADADKKAAVKEQEKAEKAAAAEKAKAEKEAKKEPEQNGVRKPSAGGKCRAAWDIFDAVSTELGSCAPISYVLPVGVARGLNEANIKAEYARWKKYHGITGRVAVPVPAAIAAAAAKVQIGTAE